MAVFAREQTAGKGQRGRVWTSEKSSNIILSVVANPGSLMLSQQFRLVAAISVATARFFSKYAGDQTRIKWPNDLYWQDRKAGGVLIESRVESRESGIGSWESGLPAEAKAQAVGGWKWAIIGVGININQVMFPAELPNPVSLKQITGKDFEPVSLAKELCRFMDQYFQLLADGFENIHKEYNDLLYKRNEKVKLRSGSRVFEAVIKEVSVNGKLVVQHAIEEEFNFGEIEWIVI